MAGVSLCAARPRPGPLEGQAFSRPCFPFLMSVVPWQDQGDEARFLGAGRVLEPGSPLAEQEEERERGARGQGSLEAVALPPWEEPECGQGCLCSARPVWGAAGTGMRPRGAGGRASRSDVGSRQSRPGKWSRKKAPQGHRTMPLGLVRALPSRPHSLCLRYLCDLSSRGKRPAVILCRTRVLGALSPEQGRGVDCGGRQQGSPRPRLPWSSPAWGRWPLPSTACTPSAGIAGAQLAS